MTEKINEELKAKEMNTKAALIKKIDSLRNRMPTSLVNSFDVFIRGVKKGANKDKK